MYFVRNVKLLSILLAFVLVVNMSFPMGAKTSAASGEQVQTLVESFSSDTYSATVNSEGFYEHTGHKKVNSVTTTTQTASTVHTVAELVEDYYDVNGNYVNTEVKIQEYNNNYNTGKATGGEVIEVLSTPMAIKEDIETFENGILSTKQVILKNDVASSVKSIANEVGKLELEEVPGYTRKQIKELKDSVAELKEKYTLEIDPSAPTGEKIQVVEKNSSAPDASIFANYSAGAFDNYYRFDSTTTNFTIQALSAVPHNYIRITGSTLNNSLNAKSLQTFQAHINMYEEYLIKQMNYNTLGTTFDWFFLVAGLVSLVAGFVGGPLGWGSIVLNFIGALSLFRDLTSLVYGNQQRLSLSRSATVRQQNARDMIMSSGNKFTNTTMTFHTGY